VLAAFLAVVGVTFAGVALGDVILGDGDNLATNGNQTTMAFGNVCAGESYAQDAGLFILRNGTNTARIYKDGTAVALSVVCTSTSQLAATNPADLTMPANWSAAAQNTLYPPGPASTSTSTVTLTPTGAPGPYTGTVTFRSSGLAQTDATWVDDDDMDVTWTVVECAKPEIKVEKTAAAEYFVAGGPVAYEYEVTNPGNVPLSNVAVTDDMCGAATYQSGDANTDTKLDEAETWIFTCSYTPAFTGPSSVLDNVATATGTYGTTTVDDKVGFKLMGAVIRKAVFLYWQAGGPDKYVDYDASGVNFTVDLYERGVGHVGTETVAENDPLQLWLTLKPSNASEAGWTFVEQPKPGYPVADGRGTIGFDVRVGGGYLDNTLIDTIDFDLAIDKWAPKFVGESGVVTFNYKVTNTGPAAVKPVVTDDSCSSVVYDSGDTSGDGLIQPNETWYFKCNDTLSWHFGWDFGTSMPKCDTNTATVVDDEKPDPSFWSPWEFYGGETAATLVDNTDTFTLCPWILRKDVVEFGTGSQLVDTTMFAVTIKQGSTVIGTVTIKEGDPAQFWLAPGTYSFCETVLPFYIPNHECWTQVVGTDYPDWTVVNSRWYGFSHGYYKNQGYRIGWQNLVPPVAAAYAPGTKVGTVFTVPAALRIGTKWIGDFTLYEALSFKGGPDASGKAQILLRQAVAALLNESRFGPSFGDFTLAELIADVNAALAGSESDMTHLAGVLDRWNNGYVVAP
jgi:uncharacterized repeat protein (TIGR01451 family)